MLLALLMCSTATAGNPALFLSPDDPSLTWVACDGTEADQCAIAVIQGEMAEPNADVFLRMGGGFTFPWHKHTSAEHIVVLSGQLVVEYEGQEEDTINGGSYLYGPADRFHHGRCGPGDDCLMFISFDAPFDYILKEE